MYVVYINLLYFLSIFLFTYNKNLLSQKTWESGLSSCITDGTVCGRRNNDVTITITLILIGASSMFILKLTLFLGIAEV